jgi:hypothetical protein
MSLYMGALTHENSRRILAFDVAATGLHPTDNQRRAMVERTAKLRRKIFAWIDVQSKFLPELERLRELQDEARARVAGTQPVPGIKVPDIALWLPSSIVAGAAPPTADVSHHMQSHIICCWVVEMIKILQDRPPLRSGTFTNFSGNNATSLTSIK